MIQESLWPHTVQSQSTQKYSSRLENAFDHPPGLARFDLETLEATKEYKDWSNSKSNCMLLLHGDTKADQTSLCWLSPASISLAASLKKRARSVEGNKVAVAEVYCKTSDLTTETHRSISDCSVVLSLVSQLLGANPAIVDSREAFSRLQAAIQPLIATTSRGESSSGRKRFTSAHDFSEAIKVLSRDCLGHFDEVYLIIDRVDMISGPGSFLENFITNIVENRRATRVRVMCVAAREGSEATSKIDEVCREFEGRRFVSLRVDQDRA